jgi:hypothetical protein
MVITTNKHDPTHREYRWTVGAVTMKIQEKNAHQPQNQTKAVTSEWPLQVNHQLTHKYYQNAH